MQHKLCTTKGKTDTNGSHLIMCTMRTRACTQTQYCTDTSSELRYDLTRLEHLYLWLTLTKPKYNFNIQITQIRTHWRLHLF